MADMLDAMSKLAKAHDYFGKAKTLNDSIKKVRDASKMDPKDPKELKRFIGIADKESEKLIKALSDRAKATEEAAKAKFPAVASNTPDRWAKWCAAIYKHGEESPQAKKARGVYL